MSLKLINCVVLVALNQTKSINYVMLAMPSTTFITIFVLYPSGPADPCYSPKLLGTSSGPQDNYL
jgi:hypothetical protein